MTRKHHQHDVRLTSKDEGVLDELCQRVVQKPNWLQLGVLEAMELAVDNLRSTLGDQQRVIQFVENPAITMQFPIEWHPAVGCEGKWDVAARKAVTEHVYESRQHLGNSIVRYAHWFRRTKALRTLTCEAAYCTTDKQQGRIVPAHLRNTCLSFSTVEATAMIDQFFLPVFLGPFFEQCPQPDWDAQSWRDAAIRSPKWSTSVVSNNQNISVAIVGLLNPMISDDDHRRCHISLDLYLQCDHHQFTKSALSHPISLLEQLQRQVKSRIIALNQSVQIPTPSSEKGSSIAVESHLGFPPLMEKLSRIENFVSVVPEILSKLSEISVAPSKMTLVKTTPKDRIVVNVKNNTITIDGEVMLLKTPQQAEFLRFLHDHAPGYIGPKALRENDLKQRPDRILERLDIKIREHIEVNKAGHRFKIR